MANLSTSIGQEIHVVIGLLLLMRIKDRTQIYISYSACIDWMVIERVISYSFSLQCILVSFPYTSAWPRTPKDKPCLLAYINVNSEFKHHKLILFHLDFSWEHLIMGQIPK